MKATPPDIVRPFYRSEAFPEDVADLVESATAVAATRQQRRQSSKLWLLSLLPIAAVAATAVVLLQRLL
jgi:hypothetical protein